MSKARLPFIVLCVAMGCTDPPSAPPSTIDSGSADVSMALDALDARAPGVSDGSMDTTRVQPDVVRRPDLGMEDIQCPVGDGSRPCIHGVSGRVVDTSGIGVAGRIVTMCGPACFIEQTGSDGRFRVLLEDLVDLSVYALSVHGRPNYGSVFVPLPPAVNGEVVFRDPIIITRLSDVGPQMPDPARGGEVTAGEVTLTVPAGATFEYDLEDEKLGMLGRTFRVGYLPPTSLPTFMPTAVGTLYVFGPFNFASTRPLGLRVTNRAMLPAGAAVDFVAMNTEAFAPPFNAGRPMPGIIGHVSPDGRSISMDPGLGVSILSWIAIRPRD